MNDSKTEFIEKQSKKYVKPYSEYIALASRVLVVVIPGAIGDWTTYCDAVPGENHQNEVAGVANEGDKISKELACFLFPQFDPKRYRE